MRFDRSSVFAMVLASTVSMASCSSDEEGSSGTGAVGASGSGASSGSGAGSGSGAETGSGAGGSSATAGGAGGTVSTGGAGGSVSTGGAGGSVSTGGAGGSVSTGGAGGTMSSGGAGVGGAMSTGGAGVGGTGGAIPFCGTTQCTDCIDNDGDGEMDGFDAECVGPLDNDEGSFATGIPGDNSDACKQDCFFDGDSGSGNDGCLWNLKCDPLSPGAPDCPYDADFNNCPPPATQQCIDVCLSYTPNGCDCFGCCDVELSTGQTVTIKLGPGCTEETATDPTVCKPCTKVASCSNTCETCEYCLGKTELPPECTPSGSGGGGGMGGAGGTAGMGGQGGSTPTCDPGVQVCTQTMPCPANFYCLTGCCVPIPE